MRLERESTGVGSAFRRPGDPEAHHFLEEDQTGEIFAGLDVSEGLADLEAVNRSGTRLEGCGRCDDSAVSDRASARAVAECLKLWLHRSGESDYASETEGPPCLYRTAQSQVCRGAGMQNGLRAPLREKFNFRSSL